MKDYKQIPAILHVHTKASGGRYTLDEIGSLARQKGIRAVFTSEKIHREWSYGISPFENVLKIKVKDKSLSPSGIEQYLKMVDRADSGFNDVVFLPGFEVSPYYRWEGSLRSGNMTIRDWDREMLVFGLKHPKDWKGLPYTNNPDITHFNAASITAFALGVILFAVATRLFFLKRFRSFRVGSLCAQKIRCCVHPFRSLAVIMAATALISVGVGFPSRQLAYDPYSPAPETEPYQRLIDYVSSKDGITVWSHPEARWEEKHDAKDFLPGLLSRIPFLPADFTVTARGIPYPHLLKETSGFDSFAALYEGYSKIAPPGGVWDQSLVEFTAGLRSKPFWTVGELDYYGTEKNKPLDHVQTVFLARSNSRDELIDAFKNGRMYVVQSTGNASLRMKDFTVESGNEIATLGESLCFSGGVSVTAGIFSIPENETNVRVNLIKNGETIRSYEGNTPINIYYTDDDMPKNRMDYYRIDVRGVKGGKLIGNPVFVHKYCDSKTGGVL